MNELVKCLNLEYTTKESYISLETRNRKNWHCIWEYMNTSGKGYVSNVPDYYG